MEKLVIGTKEIVEYHGKCPICGKEQKDSYESKVDILCTKCLIEQMKKEIKKTYKYLIESTITYISGYTSIKDYKYITTIRVKTLENKEYTLTGFMRVKETVDEE